MSKFSPEVITRLESIAARLEISPDKTVEIMCDWVESHLDIMERLQSKDSNSISPELMKNKPCYVFISNSEARSGLTSSEYEAIKMLLGSVERLITTVSQLTKAIFTLDRQTNSSVETFKSLTSAKKNQVRPSTREAEASVNKAIDLIMEYNNSLEEGDKYKKWYIGHGVLRSLCGRGYKVITRMLERRKDEIDAHHQRHGLDEKHNLRGYNYPSIGEVISFE